jgi:hypothetical protein
MSMNILAAACAACAAENDGNPNILAMHKVCVAARHYTAPADPPQSLKRAAALHLLDVALAQTMEALENVENTI